MLLIALAAALIAGSGCKSANPTVGPALLRLGVSTGAGYALQKYPVAVPGVRAGADIVCALANGTNPDPAQMVAALDAYGQKSPEAVLILNAALAAYEIVYEGLNNTNQTAAQPYAMALCGGLTDALALYGGGAVNVPATRALSPFTHGSPKFPQVRYP